MRFSTFSIFAALSLAGLSAATPIPTASPAVVLDDVAPIEALDFEPIDFGIDRDDLQNIFMSHGATEDILDRMLAIAEARASSLDDEGVTYLPLFTSALADSIPSPSSISSFFSSFFASPKAAKVKAGKRKARRTGSRHP